LLGALLAGTTSRIRIGSGGASLTYASPYRLAEDARLIEFMLPGRFDLGVTRGLLAEGAVSRAILDGRPDSRDDYGGRLELLHELVTGRGANGLEPYLEAGPPIWVLGLSRESAEFAGRYGTGFCFSVHHAAPGVDAAFIIGRYRRCFVPSPEFPEPDVIVVARVVSAATDAEAEELATLVEPSRPSFAPTIVGKAEDCVENLRGIAKSLGADEIMLIDFLLRRQEARLEMYRLIAGAAGLTSPENAC
jgi:alkanesulfonate monooxygenase SsuD/methylene tetrahydromethanopterin reductase-like flavin-dependent oxidoreductase (luciferase family)